MECCVVGQNEALTSIAKSWAEEKKVSSSAKPGCETRRLPAAKNNCGAKQEWVYNSKRQETMSIRRTSSGQPSGFAEWLDGPLAIR